jgi:HSP20 family protein
MASTQGYSPAKPTALTAVDSSFEPPIELREGDYSFSIYADLPGVTAQEIYITSCTTSVTISGQRQLPHINTESIHAEVTQRVFSDLLTGQFERVVQLPQPILEKQVYAEYSHGVLKLELPKQLCANNPEKLPPACQTITV